MIRAVDIHKSFDNLEVLKGIDLTIDDGEVVAIVGPSGAGKTTLLQLLGTLDSPDKGHVYYDDTDIYTLRDRQLAAFRGKNIGFVFQFHQLLPEFNVLENVAMPALIAGVRRSEAFERARKLIDYMGLSQRISHRPAQLSGGERQRAAVARALVNNPSVVLADEPSGSLDSVNRQELHRLFFDLRRDMGTTFVIVTHDNTLAGEADRVITINDGIIAV
ncbi:MAG: lipoprotein ABC transporter ATP-binding protein [Bacteroides uniformis]|uniref:Lipoprotein ABC transporter ATP-binding protein n=1 Tax=Bacteroides uniformis TaxID=820 RepID=A0A1Q6HZY9_BACUN|nr:MAG: lipoprotein ABC transporter ATP-binding protein [Bacteroides uniformis]